MPTIRQVAALGCYVVASTLLVVTLRVGPDPGGGVVQQHTRLFEKYQATDPFVAAYDPAIRPRRSPPDCARATRAPRAPAGPAAVA